MPCSSNEPMYSAGIARHMLMTQGAVVLGKLDANILVAADEDFVHYRLAYRVQHGGHYGYRVGPWKEPAYYSEHVRHLLNPEFYEFCTEEEKSLWI